MVNGSPGVFHGWPFHLSIIKLFLKPRARDVQTSAIHMPGKCRAAGVLGKNSAIILAAYGASPPVQRCNVLPCLDNAATLFLQWAAVKK